MTTNSKYKQLAIRKEDKEYTIKSTDKETLRKWFYLLTLGRKLDEKAPNYLKQALGWSYHAPYAGHDGIQLAIGQVFDRKTDHLFPYYRDMLTVISAGLAAEEIIMNGLSKAADIASGGRHMSNHFAKPAWNIHNVSSATGNHTLHAVGVARALKYYDVKGVAISSQGESSASEGYVYEAINGATTEELPVIFVFQDNGYGISVPKADQTANPRVSDNFLAFKNLSVIYCNGKDVFNSMNAMLKAKHSVLKSGKPVIVHANCIRIGSHSNSDRQDLYRSPDELQKARMLDPMTKFRKILLYSEKFAEEELRAIEAEVASVISSAHKKVLAALDPNPSTIYNFVTAEPYKSTKYPDGIPDGTGEKKKMIEALNETLKAEFRLNPDTFMWGQDMASGEKGGIFNVSKGLQKEFGKKRIFNAPIAEDFIVGTANGMSRFSEKIRIVIEGAEFADYFWPAMEQLVEMSHDYWRSNGQFTANVTIRLACGGYIGGGLYHSQTTESALSTLPGLRIVYPCFADDAAGLLRTSIRSKGPTVFFEPKALYNDPKAATPVPDDFEVPFGKARLRRKGDKLTIVTYGNTTHMCIRAADKIAVERNIQIEVIDIRSIVPLDRETILASVHKTNRALVVHEDKIFSGFGGELAAMIQEQAFESLDAPVKRVGATYTPIGFNRILENAILPNDEKIYTAINEILAF
jgi:2-oxoisovalerate dehydrogenase E1 component